MLLTRIGTGIALGAALAFAASPALAAGWTIVNVPSAGTTGSYNPLMLQNE